MGNNRFLDRLHAAARLASSLPRRADRGTPDLNPPSSFVAKPICGRQFRGIEVIGEPDRRFDLFSEEGPGALARLLIREKHWVNGFAPREVGRK